MVSEAHCKSFPCTELLLVNYAKVKTVFYSMGPLGIVHPKMKLLSSFTLMSFQTCISFFLMLNTK